MRRSIIVAGLSTALVVGGAAGTLLGEPLLSGAQGTTATTSAPGTDASAPSEWMSQALAPLVSDGTITQAQADKVLGALQAARPGKGHGDRGKGVGKQLDAAAKVLGMTAAEVGTAQRGGQTLGQLADSKGVARTVVVDAIMAGVTTHLDEEVASGEHTQAEADTKEAEIRTRITAGLDQTGPIGGGGHGGGHKRGHGGDKSANGS